MDITGKKLFVKALLEEGVDTVFAYPGGTVTDLFDELYLNGKIDLVLPRHEQALVHEAEGYARETGKTGVCLVTSGPGATNTQTIDLVIKLEDWKKDKEYDRLGLEEEYAEILGNNIVCHSIPIRPGRNLAVICEAAAANHRQKKMGYNAAKELYRRVENNLRNGNSTEI